jgi:hypothetical protein
MITYRRSHLNNLKRVEINAKKTEEAVKRITLEIQRKNLKGGRVRQKDPTEKKF